MVQRIAEWIALAVLFLIGFGIERVIPIEPWAGYLAFAIASILAPIPLIRLISKSDPRWFSKPYYIIFGLIIMAWGVIFLIWREEIFSTCTSDNEARRVLREAAGEIGDQGRKRALECLIRNGANLKGIDLRYAELPDLDASDARMPNSCLVNVRLHRADFRLARLEGTFFSSAELNDADFRGAHLGSVVFGRHTICCGAMQEFRKFDGANMSGVEFDENTELANAFLIGVKNLKCDQLIRGNNWEQTFRDKLGDKRCDENIPEWEGWGRRAICNQQ